MQHIKIGDIKQKVRKIDQSIFYVVSIFRGKIKKNFSSLKSAKIFAEKHARAIIGEGEINAICIKYTRLSGRYSFLMYDSLWGSNLEEKFSNEFEETAYDYYSIHYAYIPYWKKSRVINERRYNSADLLRVSITEAPIMSIFTSFFVILVMAAVVILGFFGLHFINQEQDYVLRIMFNFVKITMILLTTISAIYRFNTLWKLYRTVKENSKDLSSNIEWKTLFNHYQKSSFIWILSLCLNISLVLALILMAFFGANFLYADNEKILRNLLFTTFVIYALLLFLTLAHQAKIYLRISKELNDLYNFSEAVRFRKWMENRKDPIQEFRCNIDFFIIPLEYSEQFVERELDVALYFANKESDDEIREYAKKFYEHYYFARKKHLKIIKQQS